MPSAKLTGTKRAPRCWVHIKNKLPACSRSSSGKHELLAIAASLPLHQMEQTRQAWSAAQASTLGQAPQVRWWWAQVPTGELMPFGKTVLRTEVLNVQALGQQLQYLLPTDPPRTCSNHQSRLHPRSTEPERGRNPAKPAGDSDFCRSLRIGVIPNLHKREKVLPVPRSSTRVPIHPANCAPQPSRPCGRKRVPRRLWPRLKRAEKAGTMASSFFIGHFVDVTQV